MTERQARRSSTRNFCALVLALLLIGVGARGLAAEASASEQQARRLFDSAEAHFKSGMFAEALAEYQSGYDNHPLPGFLINIAQCQRRLGNLTVARATYRKFIMVAPDSPFVPQVKALMAELDSLNQDLEANGASESKAKPSDGNETTAAASSEDAQPASVRPGAPAGVALDVPSTPAAEPTKTRWWLWGLIGAAAAGAVTTIVLVSLPPGTTTLHDGSLGTLRR